MKLIVCLKKQFFFQEQPKKTYQGEYSSNSLLKMTASFMAAGIMLITS